VPALGDNRIDELLPADEASEGDLLLVVRDVVAGEPLGLEHLDVLLVHLPAGEVIASLQNDGKCQQGRREKGGREKGTNVVKKLAGISEAAPAGLYDIGKR
jgi:hypothetical protein